MISKKKIIEGINTTEAVRALLIQLRDVERKIVYGMNRVLDLTWRSIGEDAKDRQVQTIKQWKAEEDRIAGCIRKRDPNALSEYNKKVADNVVEKMRYHEEGMQDWLENEKRDMEFDRLFNREDDWDIRMGHLRHEMEEYDYSDDVKDGFQFEFSR